MSRSDVWMPLFIGDYLADTMHLEGREHGAYLLLIMHYWRNGPLPDDDRFLSGIARVDRKIWTRDTGPVVREFFQALDGKLHHKRIEKEMRAAGMVSDKRRTAAQARWSKDKAQSTSTEDAKADANASPNADAKPDANASSVDMPGISPSQSHKKVREEQQQPLSDPSPREAFSPRPAHAPPLRNSPTSRPTLDDAPAAWLPLSATSALDDDGVRRATIAGSFLDIVAHAVCEAAGINARNRGMDWHVLIAWMADGLEADDHILPAIRRIAARPGYQPPASLGYFDRAVRERRAA